MTDLDAVFVELKAVMAPFVARLDVKQDDDKGLYIDTRHQQPNRKPLYFGGVMLKKSFVSYHLMPVYLKPALLNGISPELKRRMQGKSCFNFSKVDSVLFGELAALTKSAFESYKAQGYV